MADTPDSGSGPSSGGIDAAASAFARILSGQPADTQDDREAPQSTDHPDQDDAPESDQLEQSDADTEESEPDDEHDDNDQQSQSPRYKVKVDGQEVEVPLDELLKGYQRQSDYTRKTQEAANQRKAVEAEAQRLAAERQYSSSIIAAAQQILSESMPAEPDWVALATHNPAEAIRQRAIWDRVQSQRAALAAEQERIAQQHQAAYVQSMSQFVNEQRAKLLDALPEWKDSAKAKAERSQLRDWASSAGYTADELDSIYDHRHVATMRKAMLYDQLVSRRGDIPAQSGPRPLQPGPASTGKQTTSQLTRNKERLAKTGRVEDAAAVFRSLLK